MAGSSAGWHCTPAVKRNRIVGFSAATNGSRFRSLGEGGALVAMVTMHGCDTPPGSIQCIQ